MAEQPPSPPSQPHAPGPSADHSAEEPHAPTVQETQQALADMAAMLRSKTVTDNQVARHVTLTEDEVKAMADQLDAMAQRMTAQPARERHR